MPRYARKSYAKKATAVRRAPVRGGGRRHKITRMVGEKPSLADKIARWGGAIGTVAKTVSSIAQMVNCERKYIESSTSNSNITSTGGVTIFYTGCAEGSDNFQRVGRSIKGKNLYGRYTLLTAATQYPTMVRLLWVVDKEFNGSAASLSDILQAPDTLSGVNLDNSKRFVILKDKLHVMNPGNATGNQSMMKGKFYFPTDFHIKYKGTDATQASGKENQILLYAVSNQPLATAPVLTHYGRFKFYDN